MGDDRNADFVPTQRVSEGQYSYAPAKGEKRSGHTTALKAGYDTKQVFLFLTRVQMLHLILQ